MSTPTCDTLAEASIVRGPDAARDLATALDFAEALTREVPGILGCANFDPTNPTTTDLIHRDGAEAHLSLDVHEAAPCDDETGGWTLDTGDTAARGEFGPDSGTLVTAVAVWAEAAGGARDSLFSAAAEALRGINRWFEDDANLDDLNHARDVLAAALGQELLASGFGDD